MRTLYVPGTEEADLKKVIMSLQQMAGMVGADREALTANRTYYVNSSTGSNSNDGKSSSTPFLTIQKAIDVVYGTLDLSGYNVNIQINGSFTSGASLSSPQVGSGTVTLLGDPATPSNATISVTGGNCVSVSGFGARLCVSGLKLSTTTSGNCLYAELGGWITITGNCDFGSCAGNHINVISYGLVNCTTSYAVSGGATGHWAANGNGFVSMYGFTMTITGTPAFSVCFVYCNALASVFPISITFSGSATGQRYLVSSNGVINTNGGGATYLPGNSAGSATTGGIYQ